MKEKLAAINHAYLLQYNWLCVFNLSFFFFSS